MLDKSFNPSASEEKYRKLWEGSGSFACDPTSNADPYTIMMPPPNVTGSLHMGHALTFTIQDILIRYHRMKKKDALWQPGTDHAGIATQMLVERKLASEGIQRKELGREKFLDKVWEWKEEHGGAIVNQLRHLGTSPDWERERFTMDEGLSKAVVKVFVELHKKGLIYKDNRLVNWDPKLQTAISDLEVEQKEINGKLWHFRYPISGEDGHYIVVATTRPETMLGDTGVAVHPDDERYKDLVGKFVDLPLVGRQIPIVADEYADPETGSGAVKITPAHDFNDFEVGRRQKLEMISILDRNACVTGDAPEAYLGMDRFEARKKVVAEFEALGLLEKIEDHLHSVPHGDRSGVAIEPYLTEQWYADAVTLAKPAIEAVEQGKTVFVPKSWENTYYDWMRNIQPWCISRQLWWGHQIPAWYAEDGTVFVEASEEAAQEAATAHFGKAVELTRDPDVLDTWFSSALWPFSTLGWPEQTPELGRYYPGDVLVTGFDIIFFWVARMMMMGLEFMGDVPFKTVYIHALVRDENGQKMSKSKGNVIDPLELIGQYGCDPLRFTLAALAVPGRDIKLATTRVEGYRNFVTKIWNASRYAEMNEAKLYDGFDPKHLDKRVNRWIVGRLVETATSIERAMGHYRFNEAAGSLYQFIWHEFCDWYIEFSKPILNGDDENAAKETRATMAWVLEQLLHMAHPIMPFVTEEIWEQFAAEANDKSGTRLISNAWPELGTDLIDDGAAEEMDWVIRLITGIRTARSELSVPPKAKLQATIQGASSSSLERLKHHENLILKLAGCETLGESDEAIPQDAAQVVIDEATVVLPLKGVIDVEAENARLSKEVAKAEAEIAKLEKSLGNPNFLERAPEAVVDGMKAKRAEFEQSLSTLKKAMAKLADL